MTPLANVAYRSQRVAYPYFLASALLFVLQVVFGLIIAAQYVWPTFLMDSLAFNFGRATHLNLMIFWLLLGLMGTTYFLIPDETESEIMSPRLAYVQLGVLLLAGVGTLASFWFQRRGLGKPFTESPMPWPWLIVLGVVLFLVNVGVTLFRAKRWNAITFVLAIGLVGLAGLYLINLVPFDNLTVDYYWWWWLIHLWVEGTWMLVSAAIMSYLLIRLTGVERSTVYRWLYVEVSLVLFTGIVGIGHHYYWIGTPAYWLWWGAIFSALEPVPIVLMTVDAFRSMKHRGAEPSNRVTWYWLGGSALGHLLGAGVWGFAMTLPQINKWTHGTQVTASHGHFAFFGAIGMLVLAAVYYAVPRIKGIERIPERRGMWSFWLMTVGMLVMVIPFTIAGVVQTYLYRLVGMDFMTVRTEYVAFWIFWVWFFGLVLFLPGVLLYLRDFLGLRAVQGQAGVPAAAAKLGPIALGLAVAALVLAGGACKKSEAPAVSGTDTRTPVQLPVDGRNAVLAEMRTMLGSLNDVLGAATRGDTAAIRTAAAASGTAMAADPALEPLLPPAWLGMALRTHQAFDSLAIAAGAGGVGGVGGARAGRDSVLARLSRLTPNCVSCHATYRLGMGGD